MVNQSRYDNHSLNIFTSHYHVYTVYISVADPKNHRKRAHKKPSLTHFNACAYTQTESEGLYFNCV